MRDKVFRVFGRRSDLTNSLWRLFLSSFAHQRLSSLLELVAHQFSQNRTFPENLTGAEGKLKVVQLLLFVQTPEEKHMFTQTHQIWLLTGRVEHFSPAVAASFRQAKRKSQLLPIFSQSTGTPTSQTASLLQIPWKRLQRGAAHKRAAGEECWLLSLAYFSPSEAEKSQTSFPRLEKHSERCDRPQVPKTSPHPSHTLCHTHTQLVS